MSQYAVIHDFSLGLIIGCYSADINRLQSHTEISHLLYFFKNVNGNIFFLLVKIENCVSVSLLMIDRKKFSLLSNIFCNGLLRFCLRLKPQGAFMLIHGGRGH